MAQTAKNLTDTVDGFLLGRRFVICDRDSRFTEQLKEAIRAAGLKLC